MKTFKQFMEQQKNDPPAIIKSLQGLAQDASKTIDPKKVKDTVVGTVFDKLTGGKEGIGKFTGRINDISDKISNELPGKFAEFDKFLKGDTIKNSLSKVSDKITKQK